MFILSLVLTGMASVIYTCFRAIDLVGETDTDIVILARKDARRGTAVLALHAILMLLIENHELILAQSIYAGIALIIIIKGVRA